VGVTASEGVEIGRKTKAETHPTGPTSRAAC